MMVVMKVAYVGTAYHGFQKQPEESGTIQGILEEVLEAVCGEYIPVVGASRTDSGVHAKGQMVQFVVGDGVGIPEERYRLVFNKRLPLDIRVLESFEGKGDFHVRYDVLRKQYVYRIDRGRNPQLMQIPFSYHYPHPLDVELMQKSGELLLGTHNFKSFCGASSNVKNFVRTIYGIEIKDLGEAMEIIFTGSGFLYKMIRRIVGTLIDVGRGHLPYDIMDKALNDLDEGYSYLGPTAPGKGLCLEWIEYEEGGTKTW